MAENSRISWTHNTCNLWWGCTKVPSNPLCNHCYAETFAKRVGNDIWGARKPRRAVADIWAKLDKWQKSAAKANTKTLIFAMSMGDIFERSQPLVNHKGIPVVGSTGMLRDRLFDNISNHRYPNLIFQMLTKRLQNVMRLVPRQWHAEWPSNVWIGTSVGDQANADRNIPALLGIPAHTRFLSMEPLLEMVDIGLPFGDNPYMVQDGIDWVIVGGESGHSARPMKLEWAEHIRSQCEAAYVPFFFKQGSQANWPDFKNYDSFPESLQIRQFPTY